MPIKTHLSELPWRSRFVDRLQGDSILENYTRPVLNAFYSQVSPTPVHHPRLLSWSDSLGAELGIAPPQSEDRQLTEILAGNRILPTMKPYASRYGGHQFGNWAGQLGDGRAITLGEVQTSDHRWIEFQLKGAGPTPYSRRGDGRAVLRSSIREYLCSEAMHFLGIPTTRALSLISTGEDVIRDFFYDGNPKAEPGAIVCRVSPSFLRFGHFEILTAHREQSLLEALARHLIQEHFPDIDISHPDAFGLLLDEIARRTAILIAHWMRVGFVHGVMNTDNMSVLGLTIDYGPYGWVEPYDPDWTPNLTDAHGRRYCFGNQPEIAQWNLARLCEAFFPLIQNKERLQESLNIYSKTFHQAYQKEISKKLGLSSIESGEDRKQLQDLFRLLQISQADWTLFFRKLSDWPIQIQGPQENIGEKFIQTISSSFYLSDSQFSPSLREEWIRWSQTYTSRLVQDGENLIQKSETMRSANPKYVLRNYLAQNAIAAAENGDLSLLERLMKVLKTPYNDLPEDEDLAAKQPLWAKHMPGCSVLSCSS